MIGKQCFNNFVEILSPKLWNWWRKRTQVAATKNHDRRYTSWEKNYQLQDPGRLALFDEYLEMSEYNYFCMHTRDPKTMSDVLLIANSLVQTFLLFEDNFFKSHQQFRK